ncbi:MAG TPA: hypothetical protein DCE41_05915, partial [Cytophagales bacterium]|nr:hypothetical protein [Cytophagales bacterium]
RQLTAFGRRGEQKLQDFYDLMGYQANAQYSTMNSVSDTRQRTTDLFLDSTVTVAPLFEAGLPLPLVVFLDSVESTYSAVEIQLDSMAWVQPLVPSLDGLYQGRLEYVLVARGYQIGEAVTEHTGIQQAEVYLQQVEKSFGRRGSNLVWEVKLGSIRWAEGE